MAKQGSGVSGQGSVKAKPTNAVIDELIRQSKQITADLSVLKFEIAAQSPSPSPSSRDYQIVEQRFFLLSELAYNFHDKLRAANTAVVGKRGTL